MKIQLLEQHNIIEAQTKTFADTVGKIRKTLSQKTVKKVDLDTDELKFLEIPQDVIDFIYEESHEQESDKSLSVPHSAALGFVSFFSFFANASNSHPELCIQPLNSLLYTIEGYSPQSIACDEVIISLENMLTLIAKQSNGSSELGDLAMSVLVALAIATGTIGSMISIINLLNKDKARTIIAPRILGKFLKVARGNLSCEKFFLPLPHRLLKSQSLIYGTYPRINMRNCAMATDGKYLYVCSEGKLSKIGTGFQNTQNGVIYAQIDYMSEIFPRRGQLWIGIVKDSLLIRHDGCPRGAVEQWDCENLSFVSLLQENGEIQIGDNPYIVFEVEKSFLAVLELRQDSTDSFSKVIMRIISIPSMKEVVVYDVPWSPWSLQSARLGLWQMGVDAIKDKTELKEEKEEKETEENSEKQQASNLNQLSWEYVVRAKRCNQENKSDNSNHNDIVLYDYFQKTDDDKWIPIIDHPATQLVSIRGGAFSVHSDGSTAYIGSTRLMDDGFATVPTICSLSEKIAVCITIAYFSQ